MQLTLDQLLSVVGTLDDTPGFDTPRERFRRFITKRVTDFATARLLIEQCVHLPGGQSHRALEDLIVALGRFLDFEVVFGPYEHSSIGVAGGWRARRELFIHVTVWTDQTPAIDVPRLTSSLSAETRANGEAGESHVALGILTPLFPAATRLGELKNSRTDPSICALSLRLLLQLTEMVVEGRVSQALVVALLTRSPLLDEVVTGVAGLITPTAAPS